MDLDSFWNGLHVMELNKMAWSAKPGSISNYLFKNRDVVLEDGSKVGDSSDILLTLYLKRYPKSPREMQKALKEGISDFMGRDSPPQSVSYRQLITFNLIRFGISVLVMGAYFLSKKGK